MATHPSNPVSPSQPESPTLHPENLTLFSHGLATLSLVATLPSSESPQTTLSLTPPTHQIHDILKTLVVLPENATVTSINYPLHDLNVAPSEQSQNISIDFHDAITDLLQAAVGTTVSLTHPFRPDDPETSKFSSVRHSDNGVCTGVVVGLQTFQLQLPNNSGNQCTYDDQYVVLRTSSGHVRKILLRAVTDVAFDDPAMNRRLTDALNLMKSRVANAETPITITISPKEQQQQQTDQDTTPTASKVTVRYAVESPVYKLTHRLILPSNSTEQDNNLLLQAWAIIDSPFPHDLHDISLSLIAGKPMSFRHDLASKRYIERPEETVDKGPGYGKPSLGAKRLKTLGVARRSGRTTRTAGLSSGGNARGFGRASLECDRHNDTDEEKQDQPVPPVTPFSDPLWSFPQSSPQQHLLESTKGMDVAEVGDMYEYRIPHRVTLRANESALVPVISREVQGSKVLIYAKDVHKRFALSAVRLMNSADATVEKGPVSVYEEDLLAGEGMLDSLLPGKHAIVPYAIDGSVSIHVESSNREGGLVRAWYVNGLLRAERWQEMETTYKIENSGSSGRLFYLIHQRSYGFSEGDVHATHEDGVAVEVGTEADRKEMKYTVKLEEGSTTLRVVDRTKTTQTYDVERSCTKDEIAMLLFGGVVSDEIAEKMKNIMKLKADIAWRDAEIRGLEQEVGRIEADQERYRKNLTSLGGVMQANRFKDGAIMDRYVTELEQSEDRIRQLRETIKNGRKGVSTLTQAVQEQLLEIVARLEK